MVNSGHFHTAVDRNDEDGVSTTPLKSAEDGSASSSSPVPGASACNRESTVSSQAIEPTATETDSKCNLAVERDCRLTKPTDDLSQGNSLRQDDNCDNATTETSLFCSVPLDKVRAVLESFNKSTILETYLSKSRVQQDEEDEAVPAATQQQVKIKINKKLLCLYCERTFVTPNLKQKHVDRCHLNNTARRSSSRLPSLNQTAGCGFCNKLNGTDYDLKTLFEHQTVEHAARYFGCLPCEDRFSTALLLQEHNKSVHGLIVEEVVTIKSDVLDVDTQPSSPTPSSVIVAQISEPKSDVNVIETGSAPITGTSNATTTNKKARRGLKKFPAPETAAGEEETQPPTAAEERLEDFEANISVNVINASELKAADEEEQPDADEDEEDEEVPLAKKPQYKKNKKIAVKSTKFGIRSNVRTTRLQVKLLTERAKKIKKPVKQKRVIEEKKVEERYMPTLESIFKVHKVTDHSGDSIKLNSMTFDAVFDKAFYNRMTCNIQENLLNHIDGKLFKNVESENRISNFEQAPISPSGDIKVPGASENFGCELSLNAATPVATLLNSSQFGEDFESQIEYGAKASKKKPKTDSVTYKYYTRRKYQAELKEKEENRDLSKLDMWTQLVIKNRQQKILDDQRSNDEMIQYSLCDGFKAKVQVEELNRVLDKRGPFEDLLEEATLNAALEKSKKRADDDDDGGEDNEDSEIGADDVKLFLDELLDKVNELETNVKVEDSPVCSIPEHDEDDMELPEYFHLQKNPARHSEPLIDISDRITLICSSQETENFEAPSTLARPKDTVVELTGEWTRPKIYICAACGTKLPNIKYLLDHKNLIHQNIWCQHYEFVGKQSELYRHLSIPGLGKVGAVEDFPMSKVWVRSDARTCSKCDKQCNSLGELHRHMLECGGDWTWMLARKKCKYRPYGSRSRRKRLRGLHTIRFANRENNDKEPRQKKTYKRKFDGPRPKPSDAETIQRMLANLPAKRATRKLISMRDGMQRPRKRCIPTRVIFQTKPHSKTEKSDRPVQLTRPMIGERKMTRSLANQTLKNAIKTSRNTSQLNARRKLTENETKSATVSAKGTIRKAVMRQSVRNINKVLSSAIIDSNKMLLPKRKLVKALVEARTTRLRLKSKEAAQTNGSVKAAFETKSDVKLVKSEKSAEETLLPPPTVNKTKQNNGLFSRSKSFKKTIMQSFRGDKTKRVVLSPRDTAARMDSIIDAVLKHGEKLDEGRTTRSRRSLASTPIDDSQIERTEPPAVVEEKTKPKVETKTQKLIRTLSMKRSKNKVNITKKSAVTPKEESVTTKIDNKVAPKLGNKRKLNVDNIKNTLKRVKLKKKTEIGTPQLKHESSEESNDVKKSIEDLSMPTLEKYTSIPEQFRIDTVISIPILMPVICETELKMTDTVEDVASQDPSDNPTTVEEEEEKIPIEDVETNETESDTVSQPEDHPEESGVASHLLSNVQKNVSGLKNKMKKPFRGLNDCIAMLTSKLQQKEHTEVANVLDEVLVPKIDDEMANEDTLAVLPSESNEDSGGEADNDVKANSNDVSLDEIVTNTSNELVDTIIATPPDESSSLINTADTTDNIDIPSTSSVSAPVDVIPEENDEPEDLSCKPKDEEQHPLDLHIDKVVTFEDSLPVVSDVVHSVEDTVTSTEPDIVVNVNPLNPVEIVELDVDTAEDLSISSANKNADKPIDNSDQEIDSIITDSVVENCQFEADTTTTQEDLPEDVQCSADFVETLEAKQLPLYDDEPDNIIDEDSMEECPTIETMIVENPAIQKSISDSSSVSLAILANECKQQMISSCLPPPLETHFPCAIENNNLEPEDKIKISEISEDAIVVKEDAPLLLNAKPKNDMRRGKKKRQRKIGTKRIRVPRTTTVINTEVAEEAVVSETIPASEDLPEKMTCVAVNDVDNDSVVENVKTDSNDAVLVDVETRSTSLVEDVETKSTFAVDDVDPDCVLKTEGFKTESTDDVNVGTVVDNSEADSPPIEELNTAFVEPIVDEIKPIENGLSDIEDVPLSQYIKLSAINKTRRKVKVKRSKIFKRRKTLPKLKVEPYEEVSETENVVDIIDKIVVEEKPELAKIEEIPELETSSNTVLSVATAEEDLLEDSKDDLLRIGREKVLNIDYESTNSNILPEISDVVEYNSETNHQDSGKENSRNITKPKIKRGKKAKLQKVGKKQNKKVVVKTEINCVPKPNASEQQIMTDFVNKISRISENVEPELMEDKELVKDVVLDVHKSDSEDEIPLSRLAKPIIEDTNDSVVSTKEEVIDDDIGADVYDFNTEEDVKIEEKHIPDLEFEDDTRFDEPEILLTVGNIESQNGIDSCVDPLAESTDVIDSADRSVSPIKLEAGEIPPIGSNLTTEDLQTNGRLTLNIKTNMRIKFGRNQRRRTGRRRTGKIKKPPEEIVCLICNKTFARMNGLALHKRTLTHIARLSELEAREAEAKNKVEEGEIVVKTCEDDVESSPEPESIADNFFGTSISLAAKSGNLKLADIINDVLDKPVGEQDSFSNIVFNSSLSPDDCYEKKRYRSLGERKSFDSDNVLLPHPKLEDFSAPSVNDTILTKQISILENIILEESTKLKYMDDTNSLSSSQSNSDQNSVTVAKPFENSQIEFSHNTNIMSSFIKPTENNFLKPTQNSFEEISEDGRNHFDDLRSRKILNRDEELFLECCSLLKSGSEISNNSKKSMKNITMFDEFKYKQTDEPDWLEEKNISEDRDANEDKTVSNDFVADNSRIDTPLGDSFGIEDWSGSNDISDDWIAQTCSTESEEVSNAKANEWLDKTKTDKSKTNSFENYFSDTPHSPDFMSCDSKNDVSAEENTKLTSEIVHNIERTDDEDDDDDEDEGEDSRENGKLHDKEITGRKIVDQLQKLPKDENNEDDEDDNDQDEEDDEEEDDDDESASEADEGFKMTVVSRFGGLMARALKNKLHEVVGRRKLRHKRSSESTQTSITDYAVPLKKHKHDNDSKKMPTKGALKVFEGLKVSIPTDDLNMDEVLNCSPKSKKLELGLPEAAIKPEPEPVQAEVVSKKKKTVFEKFGNKLGLKITKKRNMQRAAQRKRMSKNKSKILSSDFDNQVHDIYDFEETQDNTDVFTSNSLSFKSFRSKTCEEKTKDPKMINEEKFDSFTFGEVNSNSSMSTTASSTPSKRNGKNSTKKKCMIMGRIFKNALKSKVDDVIPVNENVKNEQCVELTPNDSVENVAEDSLEKIMTEREMNFLFDKLLNENQAHIYQNSEQNIPIKEELKIVPPKLIKLPSKIKAKQKKRRHNSSESTDCEFSLNRSSKSTKKRATNTKRFSKKRDDPINLEQELKECIGVAGRKSQRKCTSGKQNVLVEYWSSDESSFETFIANTMLDDKPVPNHQEEDSKHLLDVAPQIVEDVKLEDALPELPIIVVEDSIKEEPEIKDVVDLTPKEEEFDLIDLDSSIAESKRAKKQKRKKSITKHDKPKKHRKKCLSESGAILSNSAENLANTRRKRNAADTLYYWSSSSDDEFQDLIEVKPIREEDDVDRPMQHGWIVGDSPKKLVTMLAQAKGKKVESECVKEAAKKRFTM